MVDCGKSMANAIVVCYAITREMAGLSADYLALEFARPSK